MVMTIKPLSRSIRARLMLQKVLVGSMECKRIARTKLQWAGTTRRSFTNMLLRQVAIILWNILEGLMLL